MLRRTNPNTDTQSEESGQINTHEKAHLFLIQTPVRFQG